MKRRSFIGTCLGLLFGGRAVGVPAGDRTQHFVNPKLAAYGSSAWPNSPQYVQFRGLSLDEALDPLNYLDFRVLPGERRK